MENALRESLLRKLLDYITDNNPDLLMQLEEQTVLPDYLVQKVDGINKIMSQYQHEPLYLQEERGINLLTKDLRPSKYNYICRLLEEEFSATHRQLQNAGILKYEAINLVAYCQELFEALHFNEWNEDNRLLYYSIAGAVSEYFDRSISAGENSASWAITASKN